MAWPPVTHQDVQDEVGKHRFTQGFASTTGTYLRQPVNYATSSVTANSLLVAPYVVPTDFTTNGCMIGVSTGAVNTTFDMVLYASSEDTGLPTTRLILHTGIDTATASDVATTFSSPLALTAGLYWIGGVPRGGSPTLRCIASAAPQTPVPFWTPTVLSATTSNPSGIVGSNVLAAPDASWSYGYTTTRLIPIVNLRAA